MTRDFFTDLVGRIETRHAVGGIGFDDPHDLFRIHHSERRADFGQRVMNGNRAAVRGLGRMAISCISGRRVE